MEERKRQINRAKEKETRKKIKKRGRKKND